MGWFSEDLLGGDPPMDVLGDFSDYLFPDIKEYISLYPLDCYQYDTNRNDLSEETIQAVNSLRGRLEQQTLEMLIEFCNSNYESDLAAPIVAATYMAAGVPIPNGFVDIAIKVAQADDWAKTDEVRKKYMDEFVTTLEAYDGTPTFLEHTGLFEKISGSL